MTVAGIGLLRVAKVLFLPRHTEDFQVSLFSSMSPGSEISEAEILVMDNLTAATSKCLSVLIH